MSFDDEKLLELARQEDELQIVVRCHLVIESYLISISKKKLADEKHFDISKLNFPLKVGLALSLTGVPTNLKGTLLKINKIRNSFAHDIDHSVSDDEVKELYNTLESGGRKAINDTEYKNKKTKEKLALIFLLIISQLRAIDRKT